MASAQPKYDPSMEELLASIRRIISEDDEQPGTAIQDPAFGLENAFGTEPALEDDFGGLDPATLPDLIEQSIREAFPSEEQSGTWGEAEMNAFSAALTADEDEGDDPLAYLQDNAPAEWEEQQAADSVDTHSFEPFSRPEGVAPEPADPDPTILASQAFVAADAQEIRRLMSGRSEEMVGAAFDDLARRVEQPVSRSLEDVVQDCLRPMLQDWLDQNLPPIVERMVQQEIDRVARRR